MAMRTLVTGGAGYIGSIVVEELVAHGAERVVVLDNLSKGHRGAVTPPAVLVTGNIEDADLVRDTCRRNEIDAVVHLAAASLVGESMRAPAKYYAQNVSNGLVLLDALIDAGVKCLVFSSTAATYGDPDAVPIPEDAHNEPTSPYGDTKLAFERALAWYRGAYGLSSVSLRYFNAAGATARNGEQHEPETHLIPAALAVARGNHAALPVFGDDYATPDGTCIRDYVHVSDVARAHVLALEALSAGNRGGTYNIGCGGDGSSVRQVIDAVRRVTGRAVSTRISARRAGDPAVLIASSDRARRELGWEPRRSDLATIVEDAWLWLERHPRGYG
jgi:UDP-glucose 4-epimerase